MIFVTVGAQLPFDRLIRLVDAWAEQSGRRDVFAQIGAAGYEPRHIEWQRVLTPERFRAKLETASVVVAHAGMGTIISCLELGKPVLVLPRRAARGEHRSDHQLATAERFRKRSDIPVAIDDAELSKMLLRVDALAAPSPIADRASEELLNVIRLFVSEGRLPEATG